MKRLIERFALWMLRKIGRNPVGVSLGDKVLFRGQWWLVESFRLEHDGFLGRQELNFTAIRHDEEDRK